MDAYLGTEKEIRRGNMYVIQTLFMNGEADAYPSQIWNYMNDSTEEAFIEKLKQILDSDVDSDLITLNKEFFDLALQDSLSEFQFKIVKFLVEVGVNINVKSDTNLTVMHVAAKTKDLSMLEDLLSRGADLNGRTSFMETPLHCACDLSNNIFRYEANKGVLKWFLKNGANINALDKCGRPPLLSALANHSLDVIFLFNGITDIKTSEGEKEALKFLIEHTNINIRDKFGYNLISFFPLNKCFAEIILSHIAKLQAFDYPILSDILDTIKKLEHYEDYFEECKKELSRAKNSFLNKTPISYFHLLVDDKKSHKNYAGNKDLIKSLKESDCFRQFSIYGASMTKNIKKGIELRRLHAESAILLSNSLQISYPDYLIFRDVLDHLTSKKDLKKLCQPGW